MRLDSYDGAALYGLGDVAMFARRTMRLDIQRQRRRILTTCDGNVCETNHASRPRVSCRARFSNRVAMFARRTMRLDIKVICSAEPRSRVGMFARRTMRLDGDCHRILVPAARVAMFARRTMRLDLIILLAANTFDAWPCLRDAPCVSTRSAASAWISCLRDEPRVSTRLVWRGAL